MKEFKRGSVLFGHAKTNSDIVIGIIVDNDFDMSKFIHSNEDGYELRLYQHHYNNKDIECVHESDFIDIINEHTVSH